jgi:cellobiose transport system substrate-binding protein
VRVFRAVLVGVLAVTSACSTAIGGTPVADPRAKRAAEPDEAVTLTVMVPGELGYEDLLADYQRDHPTISVQLQKLEPAAYQQKLRTMLAAGQAPDVVVLGDEVRAQYFGRPGLFADLAEVGPEVDKDRWLDWKYEGGLAKDGTLVGYGADTGPFGMAYRTDLFAAAGLPTDPAQVGQLFRTWDSYFAAGDQYVQATGKPWFDSGVEVYTAMQNQLETGYFDEDDQLVIESNKDIRANWDAVTGAVGRGQSARLEPFTPGWFSAFPAASFATLPAPYWMLALIKSSTGTAGAGKWAVADLFPGGGANWGGSYLAVPKDSGHAEQAADLAAWLTAPEQQVRSFTATGAFPSQVDALAAREVHGVTDDYFATPGTGETYTELAREVSVVPYHAPLDSRVQAEAVNPALLAVERGTPPDAGWQQAVSKAGQVG